MISLNTSMTIPGFMSGKSGIANKAYAAAVDTWVSVLVLGLVVFSITSTSTTSNGANFQQFTTLQLGSTLHKIRYQ